MIAALAVPSLSARLAAVIGLLCRGITESLPGNWGNAAFSLRAWTRLRRLRARFAALVAALETGRFPVARARAGTASRPQPAASATRLPGGAGWLLRLAPALDTRLGRAQLESLLADPDLLALLARAPQAGRILRPLCHALRIDPPPSLRLPRRPRARRRPDHVLSRQAGAEGEASPARPSWPPRLSWPIPLAWPLIAPPRPARTGPPEPD